MIQLLPSSNESEDFSLVEPPRSKGIKKYNLWYNEQPKRYFNFSRRNFSFDDCFEVINQRLISHPPFINYCNKFQDGHLYYKYGSNIGSSYINYNDLSVNYIKSAMGLPFYRMGGIKNWSSHPIDVIKEIGDFSNSSLMSRYLVIREQMTIGLLPTFVDLPFYEMFINAMVTVFHSETGVEVSIHNSYVGFGDVYVPSGTSSTLGKPLSNAFGLGQWLGNRLVDYFYFVASSLTKLIDPRTIGPEILYHPSFQIGFMAYELRKGGLYYRHISKTLLGWESRGTKPTYLQMVSLILEHIQGIGSTSNQFQPRIKIRHEQSLVDSIPLDLIPDFKFSKLL